MQPTPTRDIPPPVRRKIATDAQHAIKALQVGESILLECQQGDDRLKHNTRIRVQAHRIGQTTGNTYLTALEGNHTRIWCTA